MSSPFETFAPLFGIAIFAAFIYLIIRLSQWGIKKRNNSFKDLARELGLNYIAPVSKNWWSEAYPTLEGMRLDRHVRLSMFSRGSGKNRSYYYFISMACGVRHQTFAISREGFFNKIGKFFGGQDIQLNDADFDDKFIIKGDDEIFVKRLLDGNTKHYIKQYRKKLAGKLEIRPNEVYYEQLFNQYIDSERAGTKEIMLIMEKLAERAEYLETGE